MTKKNSYIEKLEQVDGVFSIMKFHKFQNNLIKYLDEKNFQRVYEVSIVPFNGKATWEEVVYETKQKFYLDVLYSNSDDDYSLTIYYRPEGFQELIYLTTQLLKPFKDGTNNNPTTTGENQ